MTNLDGIIRRQANISSYFDMLAPCFPIFEESCVRSKMKSKEKLPESFLINLYAYTLSYWDFSQTLAVHAKPDQDYAYVYLLRPGPHVLEC